MSDFPLPEIAKICGKDARTIRRWCALGLVSGAFTTSGGHWRIKAKSVQAAARLAMRGTAGHAKNRRAYRFSPQQEKDAYRRALHIKRAAVRIDTAMNGLSSDILCALPERFYGVALVPSGGTAEFPTYDPIPTDELYMRMSSNREGKRVEAITPTLILRETLLGNIGDNHLVPKCAGEVSTLLHISRKTLYNNLGLILPEARKQANRLRGEHPENKARVYSLSDYAYSLADDIDSRNGWKD